jgi:hypothetical protein
MGIQRLGKYSEKNANEGHTHTRAKSGLTLILLALMPNSTIQAATQSRMYLARKPIPWSRLVLQVLSHNRDGNVSRSLKHETRANQAMQRLITEWIWANSLPRE